MLPVLERLIEKLAYGQLIHFVNANNLLAETGTESKIIIAIFLDLHRAFEIIDRQIK